MKTEITLEDLLEYYASFDDDLFLKFKVYNNCHDHLVSLTSKTTTLWIDKGSSLESSHNLSGSSSDFRNALIALTTKIQGKTLATRQNNNNYKKYDVPSFALFFANKYKNG